MSRNTAILVVDDERTDLALIRSGLESAGFRIYEADSYDPASRLFDLRCDEIDVLLTDVSLPGRNGVDLARALLRKKPGLRVLFISGHVGAEVLRFQGVPASDRHFLQKPFRPEDLVRRVEQILASAEPLHWLAPDRQDTAPDATRRD